MKLRVAGNGGDTQVASSNQQHCAIKFSRGENTIFSGPTSTKQQAGVCKPDTALAYALNSRLQLQLKILRQLLTAGFIDHVAVRKDLLLKNPEGSKYSSSRGIPYCALDVEEDVFIHPSSVLFHSHPPDYVVYQEIVRSSRVWMKSTSTRRF